MPIVRNCGKRKPKIDIAEFADDARQRCEASCTRLIMTSVHGPSEVLKAHVVDILMSANADDGAFDLGRTYGFFNG